MTFKPGRSGNPNGMLGSEKIVTDAIRRAVADVDEVSGKRKLRMIAENIVKLAVKGEPWACMMVADRLDGKPMQATEVTVVQRTDVNDFTDAELMALIAQEKSEQERKPDDTPLQ